jgi:uncharacterized RDD family membrane protein YckC
MQNLNQETGPIENILDDMDVNLVQAPKGQRFVNFLIDRFFLYLCWRFFLTKSIIAVIQFLGFVIENKYQYIVGIWVVSIFIDLLFYAIFESLTGGKTLGKLITKTRAVNADGSRINFKTALLRSLSRMVPFEMFSALGDPSYPWHDRWTNTYVIDEKASNLPHSLHSA